MSSPLSMPFLILMKKTWMSLHVTPTVRHPLMVADSLASDSFISSNASPGSQWLSSGHQYSHSFPSVATSEC